VKINITKGTRVRRIGDSELGVVAEVRESSALVHYPQSDGGTLTILIPFDDLEIVLFGPIHPNDSKES